jgi:hypothetical protein
MARRVRAKTRAKLSFHEARIKPWITRNFSVDSRELAGRRAGVGYSLLGMDTTWALTSPRAADCAYPFGSGRLPLMADLGKDRSYDCSYERA